MAKPKPTFGRLEAEDSGFKDFMAGVRAVVKKVEVDRLAKENETRQKQNGGTHD